MSVPVINLYTGTGVNKFRIHSYIIKVIAMITVVSLQAIENKNTKAIFEIPFLLDNSNP